MKRAHESRGTPAQGRGGREDRPPVRMDDVGPKPVDELPQSAPEPRVRQWRMELALRVEVEAGKAVERVPVAVYRDFAASLPVADRHDFDLVAAVAKSGGEPLHVGGQPTAARRVVVADDENLHRVVSSGVCRPIVRAYGFQPRRRRRARDARARRISFESLRYMPILGTSKRP